MSSLHTCVCGKVYKYVSGLEKHRRGCKMFIEGGGGCKNKEYISQFTKEELEVLEKKKQAKILEIERQENEEKNKNGGAGAGTAAIPCTNVKISGVEHIQDRKVRDALYNSYGKYLLKDYYINFNGIMYNHKGEVVGNIEEMRKKGMFNPEDDKDDKDDDKTDKLLKDIRVAVSLKGCNIDEMRENFGGGGGGAARAAEADAGAEAEAEAEAGGMEETTYSEKDKKCIADLSTEIITFEKMTYLVLALIEQNNRLQGENDALRKELVKKVLRDGGYSGVV